VSEIQDAVGETIESAAHSRFNSIDGTPGRVDRDPDGDLQHQGRQHRAGDGARAVEERDAWSYYQSKSTKQNIAEAALEQVRLESAILAAQSAAAPQALADAASRYAAEVERYDREKTEIRSEAEGHAANYERSTCSTISSTLPKLF
jgi:hypothetical protein